MQKNQTTINLTRATLDYLTEEAKDLSLTNSSFVESLIMTYAFKSGFVPTSSQLENLRRSFLANSFSNLTYNFRDQILTFEPHAQFCIIAFFYRLNLIKGFRISTRRMANLFKNDEICYFALGKIGRSNQLVDDYLNSFSLNIYTVGAATAPKNEYLFFSNYQQFKVKKAYPLFPKLLKKLNLPPNTNVIKVHYTQLPIIADAIDQI